jgi:hypothetical protein
MANNPPSPSWQLDLPNANLRYYQNLFSEEVANGYFNTFFEQIPWQQDLVKVFGKVLFAGVKDLKFLLKGSIPGQLKIPKLKETFAFAGFSSLMIKFTSFLEKVNNTMLTTKVYLFIKNLSSF